MAMFNVGDKFRLTRDAIDNYGVKYSDVYTVRAVYTHYCKPQDMHLDKTGHPGYDSSYGGRLYGSELPFDVYAWEMMSA